MRQWRQQNLDRELERERARYARRVTDPASVKRMREAANRNAKARREDPTRPDCSIAGCTNKAAPAGMCNSHYLRLRRHGDPLAGRANQITGSLADRLWPRIQVGSAEECWPWTAAAQNGGYGVIRNSEGGTSLAYRVAWELTNGPVPEGLELDHLCRNKACCNPAHLEPVTHEENMRRAMRTHCIHGHEFTEVNTRWQKLPNGRFSRVCLTCRAHRQQLRNEAAKAQRRAARES